MDSIKKVWITTKDNPWDPFKEFDKWFSYDNIHHKTCQILDRVCAYSTQLSEKEEIEEIEYGIDQIIKHDFECKYKKVYLDT